MLAAGLAGWLAYGLLARNLPVTVASSATLVLAGVLAAVKARQQHAAACADRERSSTAVKPG